MMTNENLATLSKEENLSESSSPNTPKPPKRRWRWLRRTAWTLLAVVLGVLAFLSTGYGQRSVIQWVDKLMDTLTIGSVEGSLQEGLSLKNTTFKTNGVDVSVAETQLHIGFGCLFKGEVCVENVALQSPKIVIDTSQLPPSEVEEEHEPLGEIRLPLGVKLNKLSVDDLNLSVDAMDMTLAHFHTGLSGKGKQLTLLPTEVNNLTLSLPAKTPKTNEKQAVAKNENFAKTQNAQEEAGKKAENSPQAVDWAAIKAQLSEPLLQRQAPITLPMFFSVDGFEAKNIHLQQKMTKGAPVSVVKVAQATLKAQTTDESVALQTLSVQSDKGNLSGSGELTLNGNYPLDFRVNADVPTLNELKIPASKADLTLSGELFGKTALTLKTRGAAATELQGEVQLAEAKTPFQLKLKGEEIRYPFMPEKGQEPLKLQNLNVDLKGDLLNYQLTAGVKSSGMGVPNSEVQLKGEGELTQFVLKDLSLNALEGKATLSGKVDWTNGVEWQSQTELNGINTKSLLPEWAANLSGKVASSGYAARGENGTDWAVNLSEMDLHGNLLQKNLQLKGALTADSKTLLNVPNAQLIYGENRIGLKGVLGEKSDFQAEINAPNLAGLMPNLKASINGVVKLSGKVSEPNVDLDLNANNVSFDQLKLQTFSAKGKVTTEKSIAGNLDVSLRQFSYGEVKVENAQLNASGNEQNHQLKLTAKGEPVGANLQISGKFDRLQQRWQGQLSNVAIQSPVGEWKNNQAVNVAYNHQQTEANISAHCWQNPKVNVCFPAAFNAGKEGKIPFEIKQFNLAMVQEFLGKESELSGVLNAKGTAAWFKNKAPEVSLEVNSDSVKFVQLMEAKKFPLTVSPLKIKADLANNDLKINADLKLENNGKINTEVLLKDIAKTRSLSGNLQIDNINLSLIKPLLNQGETVGGELNGRLKLGGVVTAPQLHGNLALTQLSAKSHTMPFSVVGGGLNMQFAGTNSTLKGNIKTNESELLLEGDADWKNLNAWHSRIHAKANRFRVDIPNMAKVDVSPDIEAKATPKQLLISGNVDIPWARIEVEELPESAVSVSDDEVIMDGTVKTAKKVDLANVPKTTPTGLAIVADVKIHIGDDVRLHAYGLKTKLNGDISVKQGNKGLGLYGQVNLKNGSFASFGQDLVIRKGVISFAGLPSQPTLNIEAIRNPESIEDTTVTAGVKVTGLADSPEVTLFSEPSMSQNEMMSYIMTGRGLESGGDAGSSNSIAAALIGMSLSKSAKLVGGVGSAFGISDLNVTTAGIGDNTKVVVSGNLSPKFKVKYGVGLFSALTELTLRYRLAPSLYLQWVSSVNQAVDVLYNFEFD